MNIWEHIHLILVHLFTGQLQFDMWDGETRLTLDWDLMRSEIKKYGIRNSLLWHLCLLLLHHKS